MKYGGNIEDIENIGNGNVIVEHNTEVTGIIHDGNIQ